MRNRFYFALKAKQLQNLPVLTKIYTSNVVLSILFGRGALSTSADVFFFSKLTLGAHPPRYDLM